MLKKASPKKLTERHTTQCHYLGGALGSRGPIITTLLSTMRGGRTTDYPKDSFTIGGSQRAIPLDVRMITGVRTRSQGA